jgi:hypothetical protein
MGDDPLDLRASASEFQVRFFEDRAPPLPLPDSLIAEPLEIPEVYSPIIPQIEPLPPALLPAAAIQQQPMNGDQLAGSSQETTEPTNPGAAAQPESIVYLLDTSSSMGLQGRLPSACRALLDHVRRLHPESRFQVVTYDDRPIPLRLSPDDWSRPTQDTLQSLAVRLLKLRAEGGSQHEAAFNTALSRGATLVYWLSDEAETWPARPHKVEILSFRPRRWPASQEILSK